MLDDGLRVLTLVALVGAGLVAGIFFAFSTIVMRGLRRVRHPTGLAAMQAMNVAVLNPLFLAAYLGTAIASIVMITSSLFLRTGEGTPLRLAGGLVYLLGAFLVTMVFNVPRNHALAALDPESDESRQAWTAYLASWTAWNHVRTAAALAAMILFALSL